MPDRSGGNEPRTATATATATAPSSLLALALAAPVQAGIVFFPVTGFVAADPGNTTLRQLDGGRYELKIRNLGLFGTACDAQGHCAPVDVAQDLRIAIDLTNAGVSGHSQGEIVSEGAARYFQGPVGGKVEWVPSGQSACVTVKVHIRTRARLDGADGSPGGMLDLEWIGNFARVDAPAWERIEGSAEFVMLHEEYGCEGHNWRWSLEGGSWP